MTGRSPAALRHRVFAVLIDAAVTTGVLAVAGSVVVTLSALTDGAVPLTALLPTAAGASAVWFVVQTALQGGAGSVGMRAMGLRLAYADDDQDLGFGRALGRNLIWVAAGSIVVGFFSPLFDGSSWRRGWHDLATAAVMTDAVPRRATTSPGSRLADLVSDVAPASAPALAPVAPTPAPVTSAPPPVTSAPPQVVPEPVVIALGSVAPSPAPAAAAAPAPAAAPTLVQPMPVPQAWAPPVRTNAGRVPSTLPVDVISTVPGVANRAGIHPDAGRTPPPTLAMLVWDDGTRHVVYDGTLFGRSPAAEPGMRITAIRDDTLSISKTHFEIGADAQGAWVVDRHSLNGVVVVRAGQPQRIVPGERARLWSGDVLDVGDRRVTVESAR